LIIFLLWRSKHSDNCRILVPTRCSILRAILIPSDNFLHAAHTQLAQISRDHFSQAPHCNRILKVEALQRCGGKKGSPIAEICLTAVDWQVAKLTTTLAILILIAHCFSKSRRGPAWAGVFDIITQTQMQIQIANCRSSTSTRTMRPLVTKPDFAWFLCSCFVN
jgi:hypothetical protein